MTTTATKKKLMYERVFTPRKILREDVNGEKRMRVEGIVSVAGEVTGNGRRYGRPIFEKHIGDRKSPFMQRVQERKVMGCLEHPENDPSLDRVSHLIEDVDMKPNGEVWAKMLILRTPSGQILEELFDVGVPVGSSSRGEGSTTVADDGVTEDVNDDYDLEAWDFVHTPALDRARHVPVKESLEKGRRETGVMNEALKKAKETIAEAESKNLPSLDVPELAALHMRVVESMTSVATATEADAVEARGRLAGISAQVSRTLESKGKSKDTKVAEAFNKQYPDAMTGISALVTQLVEQNEKLGKDLKEAKGEKGSATEKKLKAAMQAGDELLKRVRKEMAEKQKMEKKYATAVAVLDKVMEAVRAKGLKKQVEDICGRLPQLRHVRNELLQAKSAKELESKVQTFKKLIAEASPKQPSKTQDNTPGRKSEGKTSGGSREPLPPIKARKGRMLAESRTNGSSRPQSLFGRLHKRGL